MTRKTSEITAGQTGRIDQYNKLRDEAKASSYLLAYEQDTPDLTLKVSPGNVYFGSTLVEFAGGNSPSFTAPSVNPRIDILVINIDNEIEIVQGTENTEPEPPNIPVDVRPIAQIYNRVGQTTILNEDDSSNGYIQKDLRQFFIDQVVYEEVIDTSTNVIHSNDGTKSTNSTSFVKVKQIRIDKWFLLQRVKSGSDFNIYFECASSGGGTNMRARIYLNDVAIGTERSVTGVSFSDFAEDFDVVDFQEDDLIQIYARTTSSGIAANVRNMRIRYTTTDRQIIRLGDYTLVTPIATTTPTTVTQFTNQDPT